MQRGGGSEALTVCHCPCDMSVEPSQDVSMHPSSGGTWQVLQSQFPFHFFGSIHFLELQQGVFVVPELGSVKKAVVNVCDGFSQYKQTTGLIKIALFFPFQLLDASTMM